MIHKKIQSKQSSMLSQKIRYNKEAQDYFLNHGDVYSQKYREVFMRKKAFPFDLANKKVLDGMCAFGTETGFLLAKGAKVEGLDISEENAKLYKNIWKIDCQVASISDTQYPDNFFDVIYICGGLHHVLPILDETINEVYRILKPEGYFCFVEPNAATWINSLRQFWYKMDKRFTVNEEAICYKSRLTPFLKIGFREHSLFYGGGIAYIFIAQSLIIKTPQWVKKIFYKPLFALEKLMGFFNFSPKLFFVGVWEKKKV